MVTQERYRNAILALFLQRFQRNATIQRRVDIECKSHKANRNNKQILLQNVATKYSKETTQDAVQSISSTNIEVN